MMKKLFYIQIHIAKSTNIFAVFFFRSHLQSHANLDPRAIMFFTPKDSTASNGRCVLHENGIIALGKRLEPSR